jgi:2-dehydro-3-deoxyphosphogluconate aldolase / (4S)-4-hydroxy-2-oxoglutarate aldolase
MTLLDLSPVIPVVGIDDLATAVPIARALAAGGLPLVEVTLRSDVALDAVRAIVAEVPQLRVGVGTVTTSEQVKLAAEAGASFLVSPGTTDRLLDALQDSGLPFLSGTATPSDVIRVLERGITEAKLFPASVVGGVGLLRALAGPFPQMRFCPTGGISAPTAVEYLSLPTVGCVGGTWLTPKSLVETGDWDAISRLAGQAASLR